MPGLPEAVSFESRCHGRLFEHSIVACLSFRRRDDADGLQRRELDGLEGAPRTAPVNGLGFV